VGGRDSRRFWSRYARLYDFEIQHTSRAAYERMYTLMASALSVAMDILELATGTGLIACNIAESVRSVTATDYSPGMIATAQRKPVPRNVSFSVEDATALSFDDAVFDAAIISNALHIMPDPALALSEIRRVLKPGGLLIAPNFTHGHLKGASNRFNDLILRLVGFETFSQWTPEEYVNFVADNGFMVERWELMRAAFPLVYLEAQSLTARSP
jgi:ubiquinone/menaquinone biosynthesis C-methylase UbiE